MLCLPSSSQACYSLSDVSKKLKELVEGALQSLWVASAFIDRCGVELLKRVCARGVQVRVLTSTEIDEDVLRELAEVAEVRVVKEKFMHMKLYIADGKALTGSANLTCPVLEGKNIEILCEIPIEEAVKSFNTLWESAEGPEFLQEELWLRVKDTQQRVVIESKIMSGLHVEIDKMLKRPVVKRDKGVEVCPDSVEEVCIECAEPTSFWYESIARGAIEYLMLLAELHHSGGKLSVVRLVRQNYNCEPCHVHCTRSVSGSKEFMRCKVGARAGYGLYRGAE